MKLDENIDFSHDKSREFKVFNRIIGGSFKWQCLDVGHELDIIYIFSRYRI